MKMKIKQVVHTSTWPALYIVKQHKEKQICQYKRHTKSTYSKNQYVIHVKPTTHLYKHGHKDSLCLLLAISMDLRRCGYVTVAIPDCSQIM